MSFEDLIVKYKNGNKKAIIQLYRLVSKPVFNTCLRMLSNVQDAEETMQDAVLRAFDRINSFNGNADDFIAFVKKIAINRCIDNYRRNKNTPFFTELNDNVDNIQDDDSGFYDDCSLEMLMSNINKLPSGYKMVLNLHLIEDIDFEDIAIMMNLKSSTVRSQYVRAKCKLCEMLKKEMNYENRG